MFSHGLSIPRQEKAPIVDGRACSSEEGFGGDEEVEPTVFLDGGGEAVGIDKGGPDGSAAGDVKGFDFAADFGFDFLADAFASLDFDNAEGFLRLQEEVDLDAGAGLGRFAEIGGGGCGQGTAETEAGGEFGEMVGNKQFELETKGGIPARYLFGGSKAEQALANGGGAWGDAFEIKAGIVVAETPAGLAKGLAGVGVEAFVAGNEAGFAEFFEECREMAVADGVDGGGDSIGEERALGEGVENGALGVGQTGEGVGEEDFEVIEQNPLREERKVEDVVGGGQGRVDFPEVPGNAARDGKEVQDVGGGGFVRGRAPEGDAVGEREFPDAEVKGDAAGKTTAFEDVFGNPGGDGTADDEYEAVAFGKAGIPGIFEKCGEGRVIGSHPGYFVEEDEGVGNTGAADDLEECVKSLRPSVRAREGNVRKSGETFGKMFALPLVGHAGVRSQSFDFEESATAPGGELLDQGGFADTAAAMADNEGGGALPPKAIQGLQFHLATEEVHGVKSFRPHCCMAGSGEQVQSAAKSRNANSGPVRSRANGPLNRKIDLSARWGGRFARALVLITIE